MSTENVLKLVSSQENLAGKISRAYLNFTKLGAASMTVGACRARLESLESKWAKFQTQHDHVSSISSNEIVTTIEYFTTDYFSAAEEEYLTQKGLFLDKLTTYTQTQTLTTQTASNNTTTETQIRHHLPRIDIPKFSGNYQEWGNYRDLFKSMIHENASLPDVERMHFLKNSLTGNAALLLQNVAPTADNFSRAWDILNEEFQNLRILVNIQIASLCKLKPMTTESLTSLKALFNGTNDAIGTLKNLKRPVQHWDDWLVYITVQRLDPLTRRDWENSLGAATHPPDFELLKIFLSTRIRTLESLGDSFNVNNATTSNASPSNTSSKQNKSVKAHPATKSTPKSPQKSQQCPCCKQEHYLGACSEFKSKPVPQRLELARSNRLCFNCLGNHAFKECRSQKVCRTCFQRHHSLLHDPNKTKTTTRTSVASGSTQNTPDSSKTDTSNSSQSTVTGHVIDTTSSKRVSVLLGTAVVRVSSKDGTTTLTRALLDPCAETNFMSESLAQRLKLSRKSTNLHISGIGATPSGRSRGSVNFTVSSRHCDSSFQLPTSALILRQLTEYLPPPFTLQGRWNELDIVDLADPDLNSRGQIELLLGCEAYASMIQPGLKKDPLTPIIAQQTTVGWILTGPTSKSVMDLEPSEFDRDSLPPVISLPCVLHNPIPQLFERFWVQEEVPQTSSAFLTEEEQECENHFLATHSRDENGKYIVRQAFKKSTDLLGDSRIPVLSTLKGMENRFQRGPDLKIDYSQFLTVYIDLKHMEKTSTPPANKKCFYLPHHGVIKESSTSTKLRVVFNGSRRSSTGVSLNDILHAGPKLHSEISDILMRWRMFCIVFSADIEKMFRQIWIHPDDRDFQMILWRNNPEDIPQSFRLCTVTYGLASSPYLANRVIKQLAKDEAKRFPLAAAILEDHIFVDDFFYGADDVPSAREAQTDVTNLLMAGGFPLRKFTSNDPNLLKHLPSSWVESSEPIDLENEQEHLTLGLRWRPETDTFVFRSLQSDLPEINTKRSVLSSIAKIFDPLGWLVPLIIICKVFMRTLGEKGLDWDTELPPDILSQWFKIYESLKKVHLIRIPRWLGTLKNLLFTEIHGFSDASMLAYSAAVYLRVCISTTQITSNLVCAKSKVAPIKQISIPKLELCGAELLVLLVNHVRNTLRLDNSAIHLWTDSTNVLAWIRAPPAKWKTFVANRVSSIQTTLPQAIWHHIDGSDNPADCATRGLSPEQLANHDLWWSGPPRLTQSIEPWNTDQSTLEPSEFLEQKVVVHQVTVENDPAWELFAKYVSTFFKLLRITAWCKRWLFRLPRFQTAIPEDYYMSSKVLSASEIDAARLLWVKIVQNRAYRSEIQVLSDLNRELPKRSSLISLKPYLDENKLLRVGGRLKHSILDPDEKNPLILPRQSPITDLIIDSCHLRLLHGGTQLTLATLRRQYWINQGRQAVKSRIHRCQTCVRFRGTVATQQMGNLPATRVKPSRAFLNTGVDYCGPVPIRTSSGRGKHSQKGFISVFVCLATRAVHLEPVSNYSSAQFLAAFRRFSSRRGIPETMLSDCSTNFVGADTELRKLFRTASRFSKEVATTLANDGTTWRFNPPGAPHHGGIWEAAVKSVKHHFKRVLGVTSRARRGILNK